jgi:hypothetical protein
MARALTIRKGSSPSYTFTITDVEGSGLNIDSAEFGVGMTISKAGGSVWTVAPKTVGGGNVEDYFEEDSVSNIIRFSNTLCRNISTATTTKFIVTLPISITRQIAVGTGYTYEAFLFGIKEIENTRGIIYNIVIDSGTVEVVASAIPIVINQRNRSALTVV